MTVGRLGARRATVLSVRSGDVIDLLAGFAPDHPHLSGTIESMLGVLESSGLGAFSRSHFQPGHITASAFIVNAGRILLIHHDRTGRWLQPGGHVEPEDRTIEDACRREVTEETGLRGLLSLGLVDVDIHDIHAAKGEPDHVHLDLRWGFIGGGEPYAGDGVSDVGWFELDQLVGLGTDESLRRGARAVMDIVGD